MARPKQNTLQVRNESEIMENDERKCVAHPLPSEVDDPFTASMSSASRPVRISTCSTYDPCMVGCNAPEWGSKLSKIVFKLFMTPKYQYHELVDKGEKHIVAVFARGRAFHFMIIRTFI